MKIFLVNATHFDTPGMRTAAFIDKASAEAQAHIWVNELIEEHNDDLYHRAIDIYEEDIDHAFHIQEMETMDEWRGALREVQAARYGIQCDKLFDPAAATFKRKVLEESSDEYLSNAADFNVWIEELKIEGDWAHPVSLATMEAYRELADAARDGFEDGLHTGFTPSEASRLCDLLNKLAELDPGEGPFADVVSIEEAEAGAIGVAGFVPAELLTQSPPCVPFSLKPGTATQGLTADGLKPDVVVAPGHSANPDAPELCATCGLTLAKCNEHALNRLERNQLLKAARALIDAYGGDVPDFLAAEFGALEDAVTDASSRGRNGIV